MSITLIALLRGVNIGRAKRVAMGELRVVVEGLGFRDVRTLLNSGNIVFRAAAGKDRQTADRIHAAIRNRLGVETRVTVIGAAELERALAANPLGKVAKNPSLLLVGVLADRAAIARFRPLLKADWAPEALALAGRFAYLWCSSGIARSRLWTAVNAELGDAVTARNVSTMSKLVALAAG